MNGPLTDRERWLTARRECEELRAENARLREAAAEVVKDHDERRAIYPDDHSQPHKIKVMDALRAALQVRP